MSEESRSERRLATRCWDSAGVCSKAAWDSGAWDPGNMGTLGVAAEGRGVAAGVTIIQFEGHEVTFKMGFFG